MSNNALPEIKGLSEIKTNGYYRLGDETVIVDSIGHPDFQNFAMPPVTIVKPGGNAVQIVVDRNGKSWFRAYTYGAYQCWVDLDEINERIEQLKHIGILRNVNQSGVSDE